MIFADANQPLSATIYHHICVTDLIVAAILTDEFRSARAGLPVKLLVREVGKVKRSVANRVVTAAVFMHSRACVEIAWGHIRALAVTGQPHNCLTAALGRSHLHPIDVVAVELHLREPDTFLDD